MNPLTVRLTLAVFFLFFGGCYGAASYLLAEQLAQGAARLEPWKQALLWVGDLVALFFFIRFFFRHALLGRPFSRPTVSEFRNSGRWRTLVLALGCALLVDLAVTFFCMYEEHRGREQSVTTKATVREVQQRTKIRQPSQSETLYRITYEFQDRAGRTIQAVNGCRAIDGKFVNAEWPPTVQEQLRKSQTPFQIAVQYDPQWPERNWPQALDEQLLGFGGSNLITLSFFNTWLGLAVLVFFMLDLRRSIHERNEIPWWHDMYQVAPFMGQSFFLIASAIAVQVYGFDIYL